MPSAPGLQLAAGAAGAVPFMVQYGLMNLSTLIAASLISPFFVEVAPEVRSSYVSIGKLMEDRPMQITSARVGYDADAFGRFGIRN